MKTTMPESCEHEWRQGPIRDFLTVQMVCLKCWVHKLMRFYDAEKWPKWTEQDYWDNLDAIERDAAPKIRRTQEVADHV